MKTIPLLICIASTLLLPGCSKKNSPASGANAAALPSPPSGPVELKIKWPAGRKYALHMELTSDSEATYPNQPHATKQTLNLSQDISLGALRDLADGGHELELEIVGQKIAHQTGEHKDFDFDSAQDASRDALTPFAALFRKMVGARIHFRLAADGDVQVEEYSALVSQVAGSNPQMQGMFKGIFSEDTLKRYCSFGEGLPDKPVQAGDSWPVHRDVATANVGAVTANLKSAFKNWDPHDNRNCALLEYSGELSSKNTSPTARAKITKGKLSGETWFDPDLGMFLDAANDQTMTLTVTPQNAKPFPIQISQKVTLKLMNLAELVK